MTTTITTYHEPIITSLDIAEITGKNHKDIMRAIRNMEPDWVKVCGRKFALSYFSYLTSSNLSPSHFFPSSFSLAAATSSLYFLDWILYRVEAFCFSTSSTSLSIGMRRLE